MAKYSNVPQDKYQIKDMIPRKVYQWIKYIKAKVILKKSFVATISVKLIVPTINQRQKFWCQEGKEM